MRLELGATPDRTAPYCDGTDCAAGSGVENCLLRKAKWRFNRYRRLLERDAAPFTWSTPGARTPGLDPESSRRAIEGRGAGVLGNVHALATDH